ncbi:TPA: hypothetical protein N0F65_008298 [Lagenidium giganteum]|uniref:Uncharacterized protein n=1 Tax=Lagenidium giganteum TaxID=4803 RepID=A0AAV2YQJ9_9STRA|nr:TPA: hypothetical protein N0F65_008298 [Lagenidium giganteum]
MQSHWGMMRHADAGAWADAFVSAKFYSNVEKPEKSFLDAWQRSWSKSWREIVDASQSTTSSSNKGESVEDPLQWELLRACSSTGSRLLSDFYNLVLERDYDRFFLDEAGNRVTGEYLNRIVIINDYFNPNATHRDDSEAQAMTSEKQTYTDRHSTLSAGSEATAATVSAHADPQCLRGILTTVSSN